MTETEWSNCTDPQKMLELLLLMREQEYLAAVKEQKRMQATDPRPMEEFQYSKVSDRKLRLFAVACCRRIWHLLTDERSREAVEVAELIADGHPTPRQPRQVYEDASVAGDYLHVGVEQGVAYAVRTHRPRNEFMIYMMVNAAHSAAGAAAQAVPSEPPVQAALLRDIFGNLFRTVTISPSILTWNDRTVVRLAQAAYEERLLPAGTLDNSRLAILADALEEAGCSDADILGHFRGPGPHVRGCWPVDIVLGKS